LSKPPAKRKSENTGSVKSSTLPGTYAQVLNDLKSRIRQSQMKAALSVNRHLIELYWHIGKVIVERQHAEGWGKSVVEHLAHDLHREFPDIGGFSPRNIWRMRSFYLAYTEGVRKLPQPVAELDGIKLPQSVAEIPWGHNAVLIEKIDDPIERIWYALKTIENGWSRSILTLQIESGLYHRQGKAVSNFKKTLPPLQSDLAQQMLKDPYVFDFLTIDKEAHERAIEKELVNHITRFLLELGAGFAFVGKQFHIEVSGQDFYIDLLFYHTRLHCYVVVELKVGEFKPEYAGQINFYLSALDEFVKTPDDNPSIGLVLCATRDKILAEYALRDIKKPIGVAEWKTKLTRFLPAKLKNNLPTIEEIEAEMARKG
jgi:predicted nuclease of restriction endonuclease-like (RecB) superfamily